MGNDLAAFLQDVPEQADSSHLSVIHGLQEYMAEPSPFPIITFIQVEANQIPVSRHHVPWISGICLQDFVQYDTLFQRAKDANFDCACGYDVEDAVEEDFGKNDLLDCIFLCQEMEYKDVMGILVDAWKEGRGNPADWNPSDRRTLIGFNAFLDRNTENEALYQKQLNEILEADSGNPRDMVAGYRDCSSFSAYGSSAALAAAMPFV